MNEEDFDNDYEMQVEDQIKAEDIKYEVVYEDEDSSTKSIFLRVLPLIISTDSSFSSPSLVKKFDSEISSEASSCSDI